MSRRLRGSDEFRFFLQWLRRPGQVGAIAPSGHALASALAAKIDSEAPGAVVELGPGTGSVTRALLEAGVPAGQLIAIERNDVFCHRLRERFPGVRILPGEADALQQLLDDAGIGEVKAVVSSLPLLNIAAAYRREVISQIGMILGEGGMLVQYTYGPAAPVSRALGEELGLVGERTSWILANLPPAAVWCYRRSGPASSLSRAA